MDKGNDSVDFPSDGQNYFFDIAMQDAEACLRDASETGSPRHKRSAVRSVFAFVDGCHDQIREHVSTQANAHRYAYSVADLAVLQEESPYVDERGNVRVRQMRVPLVTSIKALVKLMDKNEKVLHEVDLSHPGFAALGRAVEIRNRVVHPKNAQDLDLSDTDMSDVRAAFAWYIAFALRMSVASTQAVKRQIDHFRRIAGSDYS